MKITAIHEIVYFDQSRKTIAPGATVTLSDDIVKNIPDYAYMVVEDSTDEGGGEGGEGGEGKAAKAVDLSKLNKAKLTEIAVGLGLTVDDAMTNAKLVEAIKTKQAEQSNDDLV